MQDHPDFMLSAEVRSVLDLAFHAYFRALDDILATQSPDERVTFTELDRILRRATNRAMSSPEVVEAIDRLEDYSCPILAPPKQQGRKSPRPKKLKG
jgi:hypothetical protein